MIHDTEFVLLYDSVKSRNRDLPDWTDQRFDLYSITDDERLEEFRFTQNNIYTLFDELNIPGNYLL